MTSQEKADVMLREWQRDRTVMEGFHLRLREALDRIYRIERFIILSNDGSIGSERDRLWKQLREEHDRT